MIRLLLVLVVIVPATAWYAFKILWGVSRGGQKAVCVCDTAPRAWCSFLLRCSGVDVVLENAEAIDPERAQILVVNHTSWFDVLALTAHIPGPFVFVAKKEIEKVPLFGPAVRACGHVFIDRQDRARAFESLGSARRTLEETRPTVIMFPEGTRSATGRLQPFKKGAFVLAIQAGVEVVPAAISGSHEVMRKGSLLVHPGTVRVRFGEPIDVGEYRLEQRDELTRTAREALLALQESFDDDNPGGDQDQMLTGDQG